MSLGNHLLFKYLDEKLYITTHAKINTNMVLFKGTVKRSVYQWHRAQGYITHSNY